MTPGVRPPSLRTGDRVAVVAPAGRPDPRFLERGLRALRDWGLEPVVGRSVTGAEVGYLAADDDRRLDDLLDAFADPAVRAVITIRGGYGTSRIAPAFAAALDRDDPIWLVGFSDVTALHRALWVARRWQSVHGVGVESLGRHGPESVAARSLHARLFGTAPVSVPGTALVPGRAEGVLHGGNLALLSALAGTALGAYDEHTLLFVEDVNEAPYRIDRMLTQLTAQPAACTLRGVAVGELVGCVERRPDWPSFTVEEVVAERIGRLEVPTLGALPCGHVGERNVALPLGAWATVDAGRLTIEA